MKPSKNLTIGCLRRWAVPTLLVVVAAHQFYRVQFEGLSSWRGGGFGMYGSYHPTQYDLWWEDRETGDACRYAKKSGEATEDGRRAEVRRYLTYVNEPALRRYHASLPESVRETTELSIWRLDFDPGTGTLRRRELANTNERDDR